MERTRGIGREEVEQSRKPSWRRWGGFLGMKVGYELGDGETVRGIPMNYFHGREK